MKKLSLLALSVCAALSMTACGGEEEADSGSSTSLSGLWRGADSTGLQHTVLISPSGKSMGISYQNGTIVGAVNWQASTSGNNFNATGSEISFARNGSMAVNYAGTITYGQVISANSNSNSKGKSIALNYDNAYNNPVVLKDVVGTFSVFGKTVGGYANGASLTIDAEGKMVFEDKNCSAEGEIIDDVGNKNYFIFELDYDKASCYTSDNKTKGFAFIESMNPKVIHIISLNEGQNDGLVAIARQ